MTQPSARRLIDLPGIDDLEVKALMKPRIADPDERHDFPEFADAIDAAARAAFGLTPDEAAAVPLPAGWDGMERLPPEDMVQAFAAEGWDVMDARRKPLRMLRWWALPLALSMRGVAGALPFHAEPDHTPGDWGAGLKAEASRFRKR